MTPARARIKRAVRESIARCGGVDGAAATAERCRSVAGDWNNLNHAALPPLDCALALDEAAAAQGQRPAICAALARELGGVFVPVPEAEGAPRAMMERFLEIVEDVGALSSGVSTSLADGCCDRREAAELRKLISALHAAAAGLDQVLAEIESGGNG